eukprot:1357809-Amphidinium_carterae.3
MYVSLKEAQVVAKSVCASDIAAATQSELVVAIQALQQSKPVAKVQDRIKLLQLRSSYGMLLQLASNYVYIIGETLQPLSAMASTSANSLESCLQRLESVSVHANCFQHKCRSAVLDKASSNSVAEHSVVEKRHNGWGESLVPCHSHIIATCCKKTLQELMSHDVSAVIQTSLSLVESGKMAVFRRCLADEILGKEVKFVQGPLGEDAIHFKNLMLQAVWQSHPSSSKTLSAQVLLLVTMTGDWRNWSALEYLVAPGEPLPDAEHVKKLMCNVLLGILAHKQPPLFPRHRWTGSLEAVTFYCMSYCVHVLFPGAYKRFLLKVAGQPSADVASRPQPAVEPAMEVGNCASTLVQQLEHQACVAVVGEADASQIGADAASTELGPAAFAALNARNRRDAWQWIVSQPFAKLLAMKLVLGPLTHMMNQQLAMSGVEFEHKQRCKHAKAMLCGKWDTSSRDYMLVVAACGDVETECLMSIKELYSSHLWEVIPAEDLTMAFQSLVHRLLARVGASVYQLFGQCHAAFPLKLFSLLRHPEKAEQLAATPECLKDNWTLQLQKQFPTFTEPGFLKILQCHALSQKTDISSVEAMHASVRRFLKVKSTQTHVVDLENVSASWIFQNCRRLLAKGKYVKKKALKKKVASGFLTPFNIIDKTEIARKQSYRRRRIAGGPWRAYQALHSAGSQGLPDQRQVAAAHQELKESGGDAWQEVKDLGDAKALSRTLPANMKAKKAIAWCRKKAIMKHEAEVLLALDDPLVPMPCHEKAHTIAKHCRNLGSGAAVKGLALVKQYCKLEAQKTNAAAQEADKDLALFQSSIGSKQSSHLKDLLLAVRQHHLHPIPGGDLYIMEMEPDSIQQATAAMAWSSQMRSNLGMDLSEVWEKHHHMVKPDAHKSTQSKAAVPCNKKCFQAGMCICSSAGRMLSRMHARFLALMKETFQSSEQKQLLGAGKVVVHLQADGEGCQHWWSVALMYWSPYRPTMQVLSAMDAPAWMPNAATEHATGSFKTSYEAVSLLQPDREWSIRFCTQDSSSVVLPLLLPAMVCVQLLAGPMQLWPVVRKTAPQGVDPWDLYSAYLVHQASVASTIDDIDEEADEEQEAQEDPEYDDNDDLQQILEAAIDYVETNEHGEESNPSITLDVSSGAIVGPQEVSNCILEPLPESASASASAIHDDQVVATDADASSSQIAAEARMYFGRVPALCSTTIGERGVIRFHSGRHSFEATCFRHDRCVLTRSNGGVRVSGRPLGLLTAWLLDDAEAASHKDKAYLRESMSLAKRQHGREHLKTIPWAADLFEQERPQDVDAGEPEEPESLKGLI